MRIDPKDLGNKRKETKKRILESLRDAGIKVSDPFDALEQSDGIWDVIMGKARFSIEVEMNRRQ